MTIAQKARTNAIYAAKKIRGVCFTLTSNGTKYTMLYDKGAPGGDPALAKETRNVSTLCELRCLIGEANVTPGDVFRDDSGKTYRVQRVEDNAIDVLMRFHVEES